MRLFVLIHSSILATVNSIHPSCDRLSYNFLDIFLCKFYKSDKSVKHVYFHLTISPKVTRETRQKASSGRCLCHYSRRKSAGKPWTKWHSLNLPRLPIRSFVLGVSAKPALAMCVFLGLSIKENRRYHISSFVHTSCEYSLYLQPQNTRFPSITSWPLPPSQSTMAVGSPLACGVRGRWFLAGLASWTGNCAVSGGPGVFTRMTAFSNWLRESSVLMRRRKYPKMSNTWRGVWM